MSQTDSAQGSEAQLYEQFQSFYRNYYHGEISELAQRYPNEQRHLEIDWSDLFQFDPDVADDYLTAPEEIHKDLEFALEEYDLAVDITLDDVDVRVVGLNDADLYSPLELVREGPRGYVGVRGELAKVSTPTDILVEAAYECVLCGTITRVPQTGDDSTQPHECQGCQRQGPFQVDHDRSTFESYCKIRIQTPPDETGKLQQEHIDGFVRGDLVWSGDDDYGLVARSGDQATVYGEIDLRQKDGRGQNGRLFDTHLDVDAIEFESDNDDIDIPAHREEFEALAEREDAVDVIAESLVPELYATPEWERALELLVAYLFGAPRLDIPDGPTYRGDIHVLIISDYGMGKSMVNSAVALFSPDCIKESVTGMSSDVGLLAAAVEDDFGEGQWTLKPGILVRANGGHVILDEIDKTQADLERMNNALEGEQMVDINKAGQSATYKSRCGLLATGNPEDSRFDKTVPISTQLDLDQSLLSRFDGIVTMEDRADEEQDGYIAETQGKSFLEAQQFQYGDRDELDRLDREVSPDVGRAWIAEARERCHPVLKEDHVEQIREWYASEVRQLNSNFEGTGDGGDMPVPVSARVVANTIRFAVAFARVHLREEVTQADVDRAMDLSKALVGQQFDGEKFVPEEARRPPKSQKERRERIVEVVRSNGRMDEDEIAHTLGIDKSTTENDVEQLLHKGALYRPDGDELEVT